MITVTESAAQKATTLINSSETSDESELGLRMQVVGGGCSGFQYNLEFGTAKGTDKVFEFHGLKIFIDPRSTLYLAGSVLDYNDGLMDSGFKITNPNAKNTCGCGESFSV
ncbi:iron-sulfur cluster assembly accessory protein [Candidatus Poribacteria bacterium]|nr:iron-sulfur cluster assembly accessory protein [Candidatus Poribacteria bacterium]MDE0686599.1 iron-sulfur cluster assembly accessory protein [Candidatus Poribacteria bacterium]MXV84453.1 iron-sulfur cluster assembly accessory protein [Candidatus Poribacteria bacterium]MYA57830.1 iron-sulfur cluster assembly accessory protein [Candidatus Poribacteria bacterium]